MLWVSIWNSDVELQLAKHQAAGVGCRAAGARVVGGGDGVPCGCAVSHHAAGRARDAARRAALLIARRWRRGAAPLVRLALALAYLVRQLSKPRDVTARAARTRPPPAARSVRSCDRSRCVALDALRLRSSALYYLRRWFREAGEVGAQRGPGRLDFVPVSVLIV